MTKKKLKEKLDRLFSQFVRIRDADDHGNIVCASCNVVLPWKKSHAGHFISRSCHSVRWNEQNVNGQCPKCNLWSQGQQYAHSLTIDKKYGEGTAERLYRESKKTKQYTEADYEILIEEYKEKVKQLKADRGW